MWKKNYYQQKKLRQIKGIQKGWICQYLKEYLLSGVFIYSLLFAIIHFFIDLDKNGLFIRTFGIVLIDVTANIAYLILYSIQSKREQVNNYLKNKKQQEFFWQPLIDKKMGKNSIVAAFKLIFFLLLTIGYLIYTYAYYCFFKNTYAFMTWGSAFEYVMFFLSVAYFDIFWDGGIKKFSYNLKNLKKITENDVLVKKTLFYCFLCLIALYQLYSIISNLLYGISLL